MNPGPWAFLLLPTDDVVLVFALIRRYLGVYLLVGPRRPHHCPALILEVIAVPAGIHAVRQSVVSHGSGRIHPRYRAFAIKCVNEFKATWPPSNVPTGVGAAGLLMIEPQVKSPASAACRTAAETGMWP